MTETIEAKADRLLTSRCVYLRIVMPAHAVASVRGDSGVHGVDWTHGKWSCSCPARKTCSHVLAVQAVTVPEPSTKEPHVHD